MSKDAIEISVNGNKTDTVRNTPKASMRPSNDSKRTAPTWSSLSRQADTSGNWQACLTTPRSPTIAAVRTLSITSPDLLGVRAKTDALDAKILALYGLKNDLKPIPPPEPIAEKGRQWLKMRADAVKTIVQYANREHHLEDQEMEETTDEIVQFMEKKRDKAC